MSICDLKMECSELQSRLKDVQFCMRNSIIESDRMYYDLDMEKSHNELKQEMECFYNDVLKKFIDDEHNKYNETKQHYNDSKIKIEQKLSRYHRKALDANHEVNSAIKQINELNKKYLRIIHSYLLENRDVLLKYNDEYSDSVDLNVLDFIDKYYSRFYDIVSWTEMYEYPVGSTMIIINKLLLLCNELDLIDEYAKQIGESFTKMRLNHNKIRLLGSKRRSINSERQIVIDNMNKLTDEFDKYIDTNIDKYFQESNPSLFERVVKFKLWENIMIMIKDNRH